MVAFEVKALIVLFLYNRLNVPNDCFCLCNVNGKH
jgi:hypothetical protein